MAPWGAQCTPPVQGCGVLAVPPCLKKCEHGPCGVDHMGGPLQLGVDLRAVPVVCGWLRRRLLLCKCDWPRLRCSCLQGPMDLWLGLRLALCEHDCEGLRALFSAPARPHGCQLEDTKLTEGAGIRSVAMTFAFTDRHGAAVLTLSWQDR